jgi:inhibitor of cysteine peptidase
MRLLMNVLIGLLGLFMFAAFPAAAATIELTEKDNGSVIKVQPGDQITVTLSGNPTTGYTWKLAAIRIDVLEPGLEPEYVRDSTLPGAGGKFTFRFTARSQGYTKVILAYLRTWEKDIPPVKTFEMTADVNSSQGKKPVTCRMGGRFYYPLLFQHPEPAIAMPTKHSGIIRVRASTPKGIRLSSRECSRPGNSPANGT